MMIKTIDTENITTELIECAYMRFTTKPSKKGIQALLEAAPAVEPAHDRVALPQNADQAQLMTLLAENWLKHNAPERLKEPAQRCNCCGYLVTDSEHKGCLRAANQKPAQAVEQPRAWPTGEIRLVDRADGCRGHYAIGRMHKSGYVEYWNLRANCWSSCSDDVLALEQAQALMYSMSPSVAPAQVVPVAWTDDDYTKIIVSSDIAAAEAANIPLYTHPAPLDSDTRKPLTDEQMRECAQAMTAEPLTEGWPELIKFARAIEKSHGIGAGE